jgi:1,2-diacylglycerol 3-alpha-glucosyltransferase
MRILFLSDVYFPRVNGVSTSIRTFRDDLYAEGAAAPLIVPNYNRVPSQTAAADIERDVVRVSSTPVPRDPEDRRMHWRELVRAIDAEIARGVDLIHVQTPFLAHYAGVRAAKRHDLPVVETYHTFFEEYLHHYLPLMPRAIGRGIARGFTRSQCRDVDMLIAPSLPMREALDQYGVKTRIEVLPTGLPEASLRLGDGSRFRAKHGIPPDRPVLLYVGRVAFEKSIDFLIDVFARVHAARPDALLVIAGEGPARESLRSNVTDRGLAASVRFIGYLDRTTELLDCYAAGDVFVFASRTETQGLVLLEAMAQGTPVVSTAELGTRSILTPTSGAIVAPRDRDAFAALVCKALAIGKDDARQEILRAHACSWSSRTMAQRLLQLYRDVVAAATPEPCATPQSRST